ncbi:MAG TPA: hypothetical protein VF710_17940 [Longimicrobium sp.]|jgi:hypothetical protein
MSIREWLKQRITDNAGSGDSDSFLNRLVFGKETPQQRSMGEYDKRSYPPELVDLLRRRAEVTDEVMEMDFTTAQARRDAIPRLQQLLHKYPHPVLYEALIHAYADSRRWDEARGVAYAARERRLECSRSTYPEIRSEIDRLKEWSPEDVGEMRREREGGGPPSPTSS